MFPQNTSHLKFWIFDTPQAFRDIQQNYFQASVANFLQNKLHQNDALNNIDLVPPCPLTLDIQLDWANHVVRQGIRIMEQKKLNYRIQHTALAFFRRFYIKESMVRYPPEMTLLTCIIIAIKSENLGEPIKLSQLFHDAAGVKVSDVLQLEAVVLGIIDFHLLILHPQTPLNSLTNELYRYRTRLQNYDLPAKEFMEKDATRQMMSPTELLHNFVSTVQLEGEKVSLELYAGNLPFLYSPSEIAIGAFLYVTTERYPLPDAIDFLTDEFFPRAARDSILVDADSTAKFKLRAIQLSNEISNFLNQVLQSFDHNLPTMLKSIKELRKWAARAEKGHWLKRKKPPLPEGQDKTADPKKPKTSTDTRLLDHAESSATL